MTSGRDEMMFGTAMSSNASMLSPRTRQRRAEAAEERPKPDSRAEAVLVFIAQERNKMTNVETIILKPGMTSEEKATRIERIQDQIKFLDSLKKKMEKLLGVRPVEATATLPSPTKELADV